MIRSYFHRWERQLDDVSRAQRVVREFDWGLDWMKIPVDAKPIGEPEEESDSPKARVHDWVEHVLRDSDTFYTPAATSDYELSPTTGHVPSPGEAGTLLFPSAVTTPHEEN